MEAPKKNYRYIITQDGGKTLRLMRFMDEFPNGYYHFQLGEGRPIGGEDIILDCIGYSITISEELWQNEESLPFTFHKVFEVPSFDHIPIGPPEPTVYFVPGDNS